MSVVLISLLNGTTDDFPSSVFVYFLKAKSDTTKATERFIADVTPKER